MKPKTLVLLAVAGGCGLVAMLGVQQAMQGSPAPAKTPTTKVLVALENIETGMPLTENNVAFQAMPVDSLPEDPIRTPEEYAQRAARVQLLAGDVVRVAKLTAPGESGKSIQIPKGMRVLSIPVDDTHTSSGLVQAGDRVDVLVTYQGKSDRGLPVSKTKTLLEYVQVFATDNQTASKIEDKKEGARAKNVALLLTPEQVNYVVLAQRKGVLSLSWRHRGDDELVQTKEVDDALLQELEGTVGLHDGDASLYQRQQDITREDEPETQTDATSASQFLNQVTTPPPAPTVVEAPANLWTVEVYHGAEPVSSEFEIALPPTTTSTDPAGSLSDLMRALWGTKNVEAKNAKLNSHIE